MSRLPKRDRLIFLHTYKPTNPMFSCQPEMVFTGIGNTIALFTSTIIGIGIAVGDLSAPWIIWLKYGDMAL